MSPSSRQGTSAAPRPSASAPPSQTSGRASTRALSPLRLWTSAGVVRHWSRTCSGWSTTPVRNSPSHGYTAKTWKRGAASAPAATASTMCSPARPMRPRKRSSTWRASVCRPHAVEQLVPDPVGLDDARVERIGDLVRAGDQRQVRPRAVEGARELGETSVRGARRAVLEQRPRLVRAAEAERVRRIRVAREEQRAGRSRSCAAPRRRSPSAAPR